METHLIYTPNNFICFWSIVSYISCSFRPYIVDQSMLIFMSERYNVSYWFLQTHETFNFSEKQKWVPFISASFLLRTCHNFFPPYYSQNFVVKGVKVSYIGITLFFGVTECPNMTRFFELSYAFIPFHYLS